MGIRHKKLADATAIVTGADWDDDHTLDGLLGLFLGVMPTPGTYPYVQPDGSPGQSAISTPARAMLAAATVELIRAAIGAAALDSPAFLNTPTAPTAPLGTNTNQIATMAALKAAVDALVNASPGALDTLKELADAIGDDPNFAATITTALGNRLRIDAAQSLTTIQQARGLANLGVVLGLLANNVVQLDNAAKLPTIDGSQLTGLLWAQIGSKPVFGSAALIDVGTAANKIVQLDGAGKLPALDGSQLLNITAVTRGTRRVLGLRGTTTSGTVYTLSADAIHFVDAAGAGYSTTAATGNLTCDNTLATQAGGRDQAAVFAAGATVNLFFIRRTSDGVVALIASTANRNTGPALPAGYAGWAYATTFVLNGTAWPNVNAMGALVTYWSGLTAFVVSGNSTTEVALVPNGVPANALTVRLRVGLAINGGSFGNYYGSTLRYITGYDYQVMQLGAPASGGANFSTCQIDVPWTGNVYYIAQASFVYMTLNTVGYTVPNGDT